MSPPVMLAIDGLSSTTTYTCACGLGRSARLGPQTITTAHFRSWRCMWCVQAEREAATKEVAHLLEECRS